MILVVWDLDANKLKRTVPCQPSIGAASRDAALFR